MNVSVERAQKQSLGTRLWSDLRSMWWQPYKEDPTYWHVSRNEGVLLILYSCDMWEGLQVLMCTGRENWQMFEPDVNTALQYLIQVEEE